MTDPERPAEPDPVLRVSFGPGRREYLGLLLSWAVLGVAVAVQWVRPAAPLWAALPVGALLGVAAGSTVLTTVRHVAWEQWARDAEHRMRLLLLRD